jgi:hypothetical protein
VEVLSPFSLRLSFEARDSQYLITPIYPYTSLQPAKLREMLVLEPSDTWPSRNRPILQIPSPYVFVADIPIEMEQSNPFLCSTSALNWRLIPGRFDIHAWQRPLNWAIEWDTDSGDLSIRIGEPLYFVKFYDSVGALVKKFNLIEVDYSKTLAERVSMTAGVTSVRKGLKPVMERASKTRSKNLVVKKK